MEYNELFEKYRKLLEENQRLLAENEDLRKQLGLSLPVPHTKNDVQASIEVNNIQAVEVVRPGHITNSSSPEDKINLFMSLFRGRDDVYAKRWQNKEGKSGYSPVCLNEWARGICNKPKIKCSECDNRNYAVLDFAAIDKHLRGKDVFGIYPMLPDETCYFLAIDFDDEGWEKDISVLRDICAEKNIPFAVERSRSGNGAHVWFFNSVFI
ncbi:MAG: helicase, partial [Bacillota bacterium]|nr:helicase [Bacillota bacterium]